MNQVFRPLRSSAFGSAYHSTLRSLLLMLTACSLLLPGLSHAQDVDNDGILDTIDLNPGLTNSKLTRTGTVPVAYTMQILGSGRVASIQNSTLFTGTNNGAENAEGEQLAKIIYDQFKDDFDFIFVASNRATSPTSQAGVHFPVKNAVTGIGTGAINNSTAFGSAGRLQSFLHLSTRDGLLSGPALHELMHRWGNDITLRFPGIPGDPGHWGYSSVGGQVGGYKPGSRVLVSGTTYRARSPRTGDFGGWGLNANGANYLPYSQLELYLMGMIDKTQVTDVLEVANGATNHNSALGTFDATGFTTVTMTDITTSYGERNPLAAAAQKNFRAILVVLSSAALTNAEWAIADAAVHSFGKAGDNGTEDYNFWEATGGRGTMQMNDLCQSLNAVPADTVSVTQSNVSFPAAGGTQNVNITATGSWDIGSLPAWLTAVPSSGSGNATVTLTATANNGLNRASHLGVANVCGSVCVAVTQPSSVANSAFSISPATRMVDAFPPGSYTFTVTSNVAWSIGTPLPSSALPSWITSISPTSGTGNATVTVSYANMESINDPIRQAELKIGERILPADIFVPFATHTVTQVPGQPNVARDTALDTSGLFYTTFGSGGSIWSDVSPLAGAVNGNALGSGATPDNGFSLLRTYVSGPADMTFRWAVSSQAGADTLSLNINGQIERQISGEVGWTTVTRRLPAGANTIVWTYQKDTSGAAGSDRGWVDQVVVTPLNSATLTTAAPASVTANSAVLGGNVTALGTGTVTERGIVWGRYTSPTTADNKVVMGSGTGIFSNTVTGLPANTSVWVRAYAMNSSGTAYGENQCLRTTAAAPANSAPTNIALTSSSIAENNPAGATVGTLSATDPDAGQTHTYSFTPGGPADNSLFTIVGTSLKLTPAANFEVKSSYSILLRATDNGSPAATFDKAFTINVTNVNELPSFTKGADQSLPAGTTADQSVAAWATGIDDGDSTVTQDLMFLVSNNNNSLFSAQPVINPSGNLTYTPNGTAGTANVTVTLRDDATINSTSRLNTVAQFFTITVAAGPDGSTIVWGAAQSVTGVATQVLNNGVRHSAVGFMPTDTTVNGIVFDRPTVVSNASPITFTNGSAVEITSGFYQSQVSAPSGFGSLGTLLSYGNFHFNAASTITISSLVVGQEYQVQIFMPYWDNSYPATFASSGGVTSPMLDVGRIGASATPAGYITGTFTATATSHVINYRSAPTGGWAGVSAVSVRRTSVSTNADLSALATTAGSLPFAAATTSYSASVPNATTSVTVTPTVADANATVTVSGTSVTSGNASGAISLTVGANAIPVVVTAQSGATKTYTLNVTRAAPALTGSDIQPTSVITTSFWDNAPNGGHKDKMIDGSGLSGGGSVLAQGHDNTSNVNSWHAGHFSGGIAGGVTGTPPYGAPPPVNTQAVEFDLGANYDLTAAHIWNFNGAGFTTRGVKDVQILVSASTTAAFTPLITTVFTQADGQPGRVAQVVPLTGATNVRRVRFSIQSAWSSPTTNDYVGLSEVRFQGTAAVPTTPPTLVTNVSDIGPGSLRAAIEYANATAGADTITFSDGTGGTVNFTDATPEIIDLSTTLPNLSTDLTISGPGADKLTIRRPAAAATQFRIFYVSSSTATVNLSGLTLTGGNVSSGGGNVSSGGGIRNAGTLTVTACAITGNTAGINSGGGIFNFEGRLTVHSSTISGNSAGSGGGVFSNTFGPPFTAASTVTLLVNTTLSGNTATIRGGGLCNDNGLSYLVNCTLTGNTATAIAGGGVATYGDSSTVTRFANTLCVGNTGGGDVDITDFITNSNISLGGNLIGTGNSVANFPGQTTTAAASTILNTTLASNGGPTLTHALIPGSPALNAGVNANATNPTDAIFGDANDVALTTDQRGSTFLRTIGIVDIGAFESQNALTPPTLVTNVSDSGAGSLRAAITYANATAGADTITFSDGTGGTVNFTDTTPEIIDLSTALPNLSTDLTISGPGADKLTIRRPAAAATQFRIFYVSSSTATVNLSGLTLTGGKTAEGPILDDDGGGIYNFGTLTVTACAITGNTAGTGTGGGIISQGRLTVHSSTISGNSAAFGGGVISITSSPPFTATSTVTLLVNTTLSGNTATQRGGAFYNDNGLSYLVNCTLTSNSAPANLGGGVATSGDNNMVTRFANTLCVGNTGGDVNFLFGSTNSNISLGGNLIGTGNSGANFTGQTTAAAASTILNTTLASNGGPTQTHALIPGSPALNAGVNANAKNPTDAIFGDANDVALTTDQRGSTFLRTIGTVDVGAFESQVALAPEIAVTGNSTTIEDGVTTPSLTDHTDFGSTAVVGGTVARTFSITNSGTASLSFSGTPVVVGGAHAADFTVTLQPNNPVQSGLGTTFIVTFNPSVAGLRTATLSMASNDADENPFNFSIQGTGGDDILGTNLGVIPLGNPTGLNVLFDVTGKTGVVTGVTVQFTLAPKHTYATDLSVALIAPDNTTAQIFRMIADDDSDLGGPYTFQDSATGYLSAAAQASAGDAPSGSYRAENNGTQILLNTVFAGRAPNGFWKLRFIDDVNQDTGTVSQASLTLTTSSVYETWAASYGIGTAPTGANGLLNLQNFAFGMSPLTAGQNDVQFNGAFAAATYGNGGLPFVRYEPTQFSLDFRGIFSRRTDRVAAGLTYTAQFSTDMSSWVNSTVTPTVLAVDATGKYEIVSVPFPPFINGKKVHFFRIAVSTP